MNFTGRTWRPPYEASSFIIQATTGCTHNKCSFCNLYKDECFSMTPLDEWRKDLAELASYQPYARRIYWTGANPFAMSFENLKARALAVYDQKVKQLKILHSLGINGLSIGVESGDDSTLALANKGYTAKDIIEQCRKLDEAGIEYYFVYMTGLAGKDKGYKNAVNSAKVFSKVNPRFVHVDSLTLFEGTELYDMARAGTFIPAGEKERLEELKVFIKNLHIRTHLFANTVSNFYPVTAYLPRDKENILSELPYILDTVSEEEMLEYRHNLKSLG